jgi:hypothetical protein
LKGIYSFSYFAGRETIDQGLEMFGNLLTSMLFVELGSDIWICFYLTEVSVLLSHSLFLSKETGWRIWNKINNSIYNRTGEDLKWQTGFYSLAP